MASVRVQIRLGFLGGTSEGHDIIYNEHNRLCIPQEKAQLGGWLAHGINTPSLRLLCPRPRVLALKLSPGDGAMQ